VAQFRSRLGAGEDISGAALAGESQEQFLRWFDLIGLQRHLKVLGIFARLNHRDGKSGYLADLPRTLEYVRQVAFAYPELRAFSAFVEDRLVPELPAANERARPKATHEGHVAGSRARRADAAADGCASEAIDGSGRQAADRLAPGATGAQGFAM
jgi:hypothetical protein